MPDDDKFYWVRVLATAELCPARKQFTGTGPKRVSSWSVMGITFYPEEIEVVEEIRYPRTT